MVPKTPGSYRLTVARRIGQTGRRQRPVDGNGGAAISVAPDGQLGLPAAVDGRRRTAGAARSPWGQSTRMHDGRGRTVYAPAQLTTERPRCHKNSMKSKDRTN